MTQNVGPGVKNAGEERRSTELSTQQSRPCVCVFPSEDPAVAGIQKLRLDHEAAEPECPAFPLQEFVLIPRPSRTADTFELCVPRAPAKGGLASASDQLP